jgi:hypothetical protein
MNLRSRNGRLAAVLGFAIIAGFLVGTARLPPPLGADGVQPASTEQQLSWLRQIHFVGGSLPPEPTAEESQQVLQDLETNELTTVERQTVDSVLHRDIRILVWLRRDQDGDGIRDFMLSTEDGKFFECDTDIDGDGVINAADHAPYDHRTGGKDLDGDQFPDSGFNDSNSNLIPDHVDWALIAPDRDEWFFDMQQKFLVDYKLLLIERGLSFSTSSLEALQDSVGLVLAKFFPVGSGLKSLRTVVAEPHVYLTEPPSDSTNGMMLSHSQTLILYRSGLEAAPSVQLGLVVHEIGHAIQYAEDDEPQRSIAELRGEEVEASNFLRRMEASYEWRTEPNQAQSLHTDHWYWTVYDDISPKYFYSNQSSEHWQEWLAQIEAEVGDGFMSDQRVRQRHIIGSYSLGDPWEFHSDHMIAAAFAAIEDAGMALFPSKVAYQERLRHFRAEIDQFWPDFAYYNARGGQSLRQMRLEMPIARRDAITLANRYFVGQRDSLSRK